MRTWRVYLRKCAKYVCNFIQLSVKFAFVLFHFDIAACVCARNKPNFETTTAKRNGEYNADESIYLFVGENTHTNAQCDDVRNGVYYKTDE